MGETKNLQKKKTKYNSNYAIAVSRNCSGFSFSGGAFISTALKPTWASENHQILQPLQESAPNQGNRE
ncbi:MAG: hypothetical protein ACPGWR_21670, partial [Ardenticatenaceae bacterium]